MKRKDFKKNGFKFEYERIDDDWVTVTNPDGKVMYNGKVNSLADNKQVYKDLEYYGYLKGGH